MMAWWWQILYSVVKHVMLFVDYFDLRCLESLLSERLLKVAQVTQNDLIHGLVSTAFAVPCFAIQDVCHCCYVITSTKANFYCILQQLHKRCSMFLYICHSCFKVWKLYPLIFVIVNLVQVVPKCLELVYLFLLNIDKLFLCFEMASETVTASTSSTLNAWLRTAAGCNKSTKKQE